MKKPSAELVKQILERNVADAIPRESLEEQLSSGRKLRVKLGVDPTRPDLHLGHTVVIRALQMFQELGHKVIFIIGDFTAHIGDPSGRSLVRTALSLAETKKNAKTYFQQVGKILDVRKAEIRHNSEWLSKLKLEEILRLNAQFTIARILERDDFQKRIKSGAEVWMHELQYPLAQAYDSVAVKADIEIGGSDQLFNFVVARHLMERWGMKPQDIITYEILPGLDGKEKMSKSLGNYIGITERPSMMFGKTMSIPDDMILPYFRLATDRSAAAVGEIENRLKQGENPRDLKLDLATDIVGLYHGAPAALRARAEFIKVFSKKELPTVMEGAELHEGSYEAAALILALQLAKSKSEARRLIEQGGVEIIPHQGLRRRLADPFQLVGVTDGMVLRVGKTRFVRIRKS